MPRDRSRSGAEAGRLGPPPGELGRVVPTGWAGPSDGEASRLAEPNKMRDLNDGSKESGNLIVNTTD